MSARPNSSPDTRGEAGPAPAPLLDVRDMAVYFPGPRRNLFQAGPPVRSVDGVSLRIEAGRTLGLVGESGCGKTTTARAIMRLLTPTRGTIRLRGVDITRLGESALRPLRRDFQMIAQDPFSSLNPRMRVERLLGEPLQIAGVAADERRRRVLGLLEQVGLGPYHAARFPHEFSGGQRQRLAIARALVLSPKLMICDEPVSALDVSVQAQIVNLLQDLQEELGLTYLFVSHDLSVVRHVCTDVAVMYLGKIVEQGARDEVFARPRHPYTHALLASVPRIGGRGRPRVVLQGDLPSPIAPPSGCRFHTRCPQAQPRCRQEEPVLAAAAGDEGGRHRVACHFPLS